MVKPEGESGFEVAKFNPNLLHQCHSWANQHYVDIISIFMSSINLKFEKFITKYLELHGDFFLTGTLLKSLCKCTLT